MAIQTSASTIPAAKLALLTRLKDLQGTSLEGVYVDWDHNAELRRDDERVYFADTVDISREWAALGAQRLEESFTLQLRVDAYLSGDDPQVVELRMWTIAAVCELAVREDITLGGTVRQCRAGGASFQMLEPSERGWLASTVLRFVCNARI